MTLTVQELLDREMIRDLLADYSVTKDRAPELDASVNAFHPDGTLTRSDGHVYRGRGEIEGFFAGLAIKRAAGPGAFARHWLYTCRFDFPAPDRAETVTYMLALSESGLDQMVTYYDTLVKAEDRWLIFDRRIAIEYQQTGSRFELPTMVVQSRK